MGGLGYDSVGSQGNLNDLWKYNTAANQWTWVSGSDRLGAETCGALPGQIGIYGTQGIGAIENTPSGRVGASGWADQDGNIWLFGGYSCGAIPSQAGGMFNDLWEFKIADGTWTWVSGSNTANAPSVYGTQGAASPSNTPGAREGASAWTDNNGNLWLFGGAGVNDLWKFSPATRMWTWVSGAATNQSGIYGTQGIAASSNTPGSRLGAVTWAGADGSFWLFGGYGYDSNGAQGDLADLWRFNGSTNQWTWVSGSITKRSSSLGIYGTQGKSSSNNLPGVRDNAVSWVDVSGNLWLFGGSGYDASGSWPGELNDLWEFNIATKSWTWVTGSNMAQAQGLYGTQGKAGAADTPGAREGAASWIDSSGRLWLFGSLYGHDSGSATQAQINDLWRFQP